MKSGHIEADQSQSNAVLDIADKEKRSGIMMGVR